MGRARKNADTATKIDGTPIGANTQATGAFTTVAVGSTFAAGKGLMQVGTMAYADTGVLAAFVASTPGSYNQVITQNTDATAGASTNYNVSNNNATASTNFGEFGINSSGFTGSGSFNLPGAVYLAAASTDLVLGTYGANAIRFVVNNGTSDAMAISSAGLVTIASASLGVVQITGTLYRPALAPVSKAAVATLTAAEVLGSILQYTGAAAAITLPTGAALDAGLLAGLANDMAVDLAIINTGSGAATITANTGVTIVGAAAVANGTSSMWRLRKTAASTYVFYRIAG